MMETLTMLFLKVAIFLASFALMLIALMFFVAMALGFWVMIEEVFL